MSITRNQLTVVQNGSRYVIDDSHLWGGVSYKATINAETDYTPGTVACAEIKFTTDLLTSSSIGAKLTYKHCDANKSQLTQIGVFTVLDAVKDNYGRFEITAYDNIILFDKIIDDFVNGVDFTTVGNLFRSLITHCTGNSSSATLPINNTFKYNNSLSCNNVSGRTLLTYIAQVTAGYICADANGNIVAKILSQANTVNVNNTIYSNLKFADYTTETINQVWVGVQENDLGRTYPESVSNPRQLRYTFNPLFFLKDEDSGLVDTAIRNIYNEVSSISYTPFSANCYSVVDTFKAGDKIIIQTSEGPKTSYIFTKEYDSSGAVFSSTGNQKREISNSVQDEELKSMYGRYNIVIDTLEEHTREIGTLAGDFSRVSQKVDSYDVRIQTAEGNASEALQTAESFQTQITTIDGKATEAKQTADGFSTRITDAEGNINSIEQTLDGVAFKSSLAAGTTTINGGCITTGTIDASKATIANLSVSSANITNLDVSKLTVNGSAITSSNRVDNGYLVNGYITTAYINSTIHMTDTEGGIGDTVIGPNGVKYNGTTYAWSSIGSGSGGTAVFG